MRWERGATRRSARRRARETLWVGRARRRGREEASKGGKATRGTRCCGHVFEGNRPGRGARRRGEELARRRGSQSAEGEGDEATGPPLLARCLALAHLCARSTAQQRTTRTRSSTTPPSPSTSTRPVLLVFEPAASATLVPSPPRARPRPPDSPRTSRPPPGRQPALPSPYRRPPGPHSACARVPTRLHRLVRPRSSSSSSPSPQLALACDATTLTRLSPCPHPPTCAHPPRHHAPPPPSPRPAPPPPRPRQPVARHARLLPQGYRRGLSRLRVRPSSLSPPTLGALLTSSSSSSPPRTPRLDLRSSPAEPTPPASRSSSPASSSASTRARAASTTSPRSRAKRPSPRSCASASPTRSRAASSPASSSVRPTLFPQNAQLRADSDHVPAGVMGRLDSLVDLVFDRYKDRYFSGEKVFVDLSGDKCVHLSLRRVHEATTTLTVALLQVLRPHQPRLRSAQRARQRRCRRLD